jgi:hypothetical protein
VTFKERLDLALAYMLARLQENSTWRALTVIAAASTWHHLDSSSKGEVAMQAGLLVSGLLGAMLPDKLKKQ